jgi:hypothetical protein
LPKNSETAIPRSYPVVALATFFLVSTCIWIFCFVVDPYDLYPRVPGLSSEKSVDLFWYQRLHKPYAVEHIQPQVLIAGSSRAATLPPAPFKAIDSNAYNVSLPGGTLREIRRMVEHAYVGKPQKLLVVSVDHLMFRKGNSDNMFFDDADRYRKIDASLSDNVRHLYQHLLDLWRSVFSVDAVMDSLRVLSEVGLSEAIYHEDGTWEPRRSIASQIPYSKMSKQMYDYEIADRTKPFEFEELTDILDFTDANGIRVILLISPMQDLLMQSVYLAGTWEQYLKWQRDLVTLVDARDSDTTIYGIEDNPRLVQEALDAPDRLFRDGIHYTSVAGTEIASCLAGPCNSSLKPTRLDRESIDHYLERVDALRRQYVEENPADVAKLRNWLRLNANDGTKQSAG